MNKVLSRVNILVLILYIAVGTFGYLTFSTTPDNLTDPKYGGIIIVYYYSIILYQTNLSIKLKDG